MLSLRIRPFMSTKSDPPLDEILSRHQLELDRIREALDLLGATPCSCCEKFFRRAEPGALFDADKPVCYACIPQWWPQYCEQLSVKDREDVEGRLVIWLRQHHRAELFKDPSKLPDPSLEELHIVAKCLEAMERVC